MDCKVAREKRAEEERHGDDGQDVGRHRQEKRKGAVAVRNLVRCVCG